MPRSRGLLANSTVGGTMSLGVLAAALAAAPAKTQNAVRKAILEQVQPLKAEIARNASWSHRIPAAVMVKVSFSTRGQGVRVYVDSTKAPHARPYEGLTARNGKFRHPVYGNRDVWVEQADRPFFFKAVQDRRPAVIDAVEKAVLSALP